MGVRSGAISGEVSLWTTLPLPKSDAGFKNPTKGKITGCVFCQIGPQGCWRLHSGWRAQMHRGDTTLTEAWIWGKPLTAASLLLARIFWKIIWIVSKLSHLWKKKYYCKDTKIRESFVSGTFSSIFISNNINFQEQGKEIRDISIHGDIMWSLKSVVYQLFKINMGNAHQRICTTQQ